MSSYEVLLLVSMSPLLALTILFFLFCLGLLIPWIDSTSLFLAGLSSIESGGKDENLIP